MSTENPFRENRLNVSRDFRADWDIPELNQGLTDWLVAEVGRLRGKKTADPGQMIVTFTGPAGYGKTHLFGRIENRIGHEVFFAFIPAFDAQAPPLDHLRRHVVAALFEPRPGGHSPLEGGLSRLCRPAFAQYFAELSPTLAARHETMSHRLDGSPEAVLEIVRQVKSLDPFLKLADSLVNVLPGDAGIIRALALGWAPSPWPATACRWLQGQDLTDADRVALGLGEVSPAPLDVIRAIPALFEYDRPMMICCDQIEGIALGEDGERIDGFASSLMELLGSVPVQIVLSSFDDSWERLVKVAFNSFNMRVKQPVFALEKLKQEQAVRLVKHRLASWPGSTPDHHPTWPILATSIEQFIRTKIPGPRGLIQECDRRFDEWNQNGRKGEIDLMVGKIGDNDLAGAFLKEWNRELETIRQDPKRAAESLGQDRLYQGVLEALKLAQSAQRMREFGGVRIVDVQDKAVKATAPLRRPGAKVVLAGGMGEESRTVVVALTDIEASASFGHYFRALFNAAAEPVVGAVMIHPKRDLDLATGSRKVYEEARTAGRLRLMPLEDFPVSCHSTECLAAMIDVANARNLVLCGVTLSADDCRDLVIKTGVIDNLDLFKMLGGWKAPTQKASATPSVVGPAAKQTAVKPAPPKAPDPVVKPPEPETTNVNPTPTAAKAGVIDMDAWSAEKLIAAVNKLKLLGPGVEPDGYEIGPTFVRLNVTPIGKTNFMGVCNKAVDLRISLGLEVTPIVGSQAGCISIDVQRPARDVVTAERAMAGPPVGIDGKPAFPVGLDVAGKAHWLNLGDPADCHLLVAGTTGSGKSEFLRAMIATLAARLTPERLQFVLIDPKRVTFNLTGTSPYLRNPVAYGLDEALPMIQECMAEMDRRYTVLEAKKLSNMDELPPEMMPRIVVVIDEFASFLEDKESKKVVTALLKRIGAMARAAGIHLVLSTQRPDKDVITPLLRENLPGRIALRVASKAGSNLIIGSPDAEHLLGRGDLFWKKGGELLRLQSPYVPQAELERMLRCQA